MVMIKRSDTKQSIKVIDKSRECPHCNKTVYYDENEISNGILRCKFCGKEIKIG